MPSQARVFAIALILIPACGGDGDDENDAGDVEADVDSDSDTDTNSGTDGDADSDADADADADADSDIDADSDTDSDADSDTGEPWPPLEMADIGQPVLLSEQFTFAEGPVWDRENNVLFLSDIDADTIYELNLPNAIDVFRTPSRNSNGLAFDTAGLLLTAEHGSRSVTRTLGNGTVETVADRFEGKELNSPNDLIVRSDGTIYFTDPTFGLGGRSPGVDFMGLYRVSADGTLFLEAKIEDSPNGVGLSPDEKTLYVAVTFAGELLAFDINDEGTTENRRVFASIDRPDGMAVDIAGNIYIAGYDGDDPAVVVLTPYGTKLGSVELDHAPTNCGFGSSDGKALFVTARKGLYRIEVPIPGF